jgi:hypothetical protein
MSKMKNQHLSVVASRLVPGTDDNLSNSKHEEVPIAEPMFETIASPPDENHFRAFLKRKLPSQKPSDILVDAIKASCHSH